MTLLKFQTLCCARELKMQCSQPPSFRRPMDVCQLGFQVVLPEIDVARCLVWLFCSVTSGLLGFNHPMMSVPLWVIFAWDLGRKSPQKCDLPAIFLPKNLHNGSLKPGCEPVRWVIGDRMWSCQGSLHQRCRKVGWPRSSEDFWRHDTEADLEIGGFRWWQQRSILLKYFDDNGSEP